MTDDLTATRGDTREAPDERHGMSENEAAAEVGGASAMPVCEHYWAWVSPTGARRSARICMLCHAPDPVWLNHIVELDLADACDRPNCVHCEFGEMTLTDLTTAAPDQAASEGGKS